MREEFKPINFEVQTDKIQMLHASTSPELAALAEKAVGVTTDMVISFEEIGINTE